MYLDHLGRKFTLVMGAGGSVGKFVLDALLNQGIPLRASARRPSPGQFPDDVDVVAADLTDLDSLTVAFNGVGQVFLYANPEGVEKTIAAARAAGVEKIVLMSSGSVIHPTSTGNAITEAHRQVEDAFIAAPGLHVVPIRPLVLATNALSWAKPIRAGGPVALYKPDAFTAPIHEKDIAAVAVSALADQASTVDVSDLLTGPALLSQRNQVGAIAAALGKEFPVAELTRSQAATRFRQFMPTSEADAVLQFLDDADAGNSPAADTVTRVLGRPAITFDKWAADHAADFQPSAKEATKCPK